MKSTTKHLTLEDVKNGCERMFTPDVSFTWNEAAKYYFLTAANNAGQQWLNRIPAIKSKWGSIIPAQYLESTRHSAFKLGLCVETISPETTTI